MSSKKTSQRALSAHHELEKADLLERQTEKNAQLKAAQTAELAGYTADRDLVNQLLGQVQMANALSKLTTVVGLTKLQHIKDNKLYQSLKGVRGTDPKGQEITDVGCWDGFCRALGMSANKVNEDLVHLRTFGEEALETLNRIGMGYRELRKLRQLPDADRELILNGEVVQTGDREALVDLIEELSAKHASEKTDLQARVEELDGNLTASRRQCEARNKKIDQLTEQLQHRSRAPSWPKLIEEVNVDTTVATGKGLAACHALDALRELILNGDLGDRSDDAAEPAIEEMAVTYYDAVTQLWARAGELMAEADEVFIGHKQRAEERAANVPEERAANVPEEDA